MIKKIICPTDFSKSANNAAEYAAKLAQVFGAQLLFINVQRIVPVAAAVSMGEGIGAATRENSRSAAERLKEMSEETNKMFNISTDYEVDITVEKLENIFSDIDENNALIVMGTNGVDTMGQSFWGTNSYHVIKKAQCPVIVVPENTAYGTIKKIVFAWDYTSKIKFSFLLLQDFMKAFHPKFVFIHVSKQPTEISKDVFRALRDEIICVFGEENDVTFEQLFSDEDIPGTINEYMIKSQSDLLSITYYNRGFIIDIFHGTVARELSEIAERYPILVLHA